MCIVCNSELDAADIKVSQAAREAALKEKWNDVSPATESLLYQDKYRRLYELLKKDAGADLLGAARD